MAERLIVRVGPPSGQLTLRVQDAFEQVVELFELTTADSDGEEADVVWSLVSVNMNSPLTVVAEAVGARPGINVDAAARIQKRKFATNWNSLRTGTMPKAWRAGKAHQLAKNVVTRSRGKIGTTQVFIGNKADPSDKQDEVEITQADAQASIVVLESVAYTMQTYTPKDQVGSVEGTFLQVATHYNKPAILIRERKTQCEVWCIISEEHQAEIANGANFKDVWEGRRIAVSGVISYDANGQISRVNAASIRLVEGHQVGLEQLRDKDFTGGVTSAEYLQRLREGLLG